MVLLQFYGLLDSVHALVLQLPPELMFWLAGASPYPSRAWSPVG